MGFTSWLTIGLAALNIALLVILLLRREMVRERLGRVLLLLGALALPALTALAAANATIERSKSVEFCLSCHEMGPYGESLQVDDDELIPAIHTQNNLVPKKTACYACHTDYTLFGPLKAKLRGFQHVYVHYLGTPPETISLYEPFDTKNCLYCHEGSRSFLERRQHKKDPELFDQLRSGEKSCIDSSCHDVAHSIHGDDEEE